MTDRLTPDLGMYTEEGDARLGAALLDALCVPAHQFPAHTACKRDWFEQWLIAHPIHSAALADHREWTDTEVMDAIQWTLDDPKRGLAWLAKYGLFPASN